MEIIAYVFSNINPRTIWMIKTVFGYKIKEFELEMTMIQNELAYSLFNKAENKKN